jgi:hypothetical protein
MLYYLALARKYVPSISLEVRCNWRHAKEAYSDGAFRLGHLFLLAFSIWITTGTLLAVSYEKIHALSGQCESGNKNACGELSKIAERKDKKASGYAKQSLAEIQTRAGDAFVTAARNGDAAKVTALLKDNSALAFSAKSGSRVTALHAAASGCHSDVVELLLASNADVNATTSEGRTPLHLAAGMRRDWIADYIKSCYYVNTVTRRLTTDNRVVE